MQFDSTLGLFLYQHLLRSPSLVTLLSMNKNRAHNCRQNLESKVSRLQVELNASSDEVVAAHASNTEMHASMAAQQSEVQQVQADLSTATAARWDLLDSVCTTRMPVCNFDWTFL